MAPSCLTHTNLATPFNQMKNGLGADALRMWAATADYKSDVSVDDKILITAASRLDRYRRLLRYMLANMDDKTKDIGEYPRDDLSIVSAVLRPTWMSCRFGGWYTLIGRGMCLHRRLMPICSVVLLTLI